MPTASTALLFAGSALLLFVVPGPSVLYIVTRSVSQGRGAGLTSVAGVHTGSLVHIAAAALGLSAIIASSATAFTTIKLAGAAYLVYLGMKAIVTGHGPLTDATAAGLQTRSLRRIYTDGVVVNVLNPKTAVFFLAFVPQFVHRSNGSTTSQILVLGVVFVLVGVMSDSTYALLGGGLGSWLRRHPRVARRQHLATGAIYVGLGLTAAVSGRPTTSTP